MRENLQKKYATIAERVIAMALESVDYNEERAEQILNAVQLEEEAPKVTKITEVKETRRGTVEPKTGYVSILYTLSDCVFE